MGSNQRFASKNGVETPPSPDSKLYIGKFFRNCLGIPNQYRTLLPEPKSLSKNDFTVDSLTDIIYGYTYNLGNLEVCSSVDIFTYGYQGNITSKNTISNIKKIHKEGYIMYQYNKSTNNIEIAREPKYATWIPYNNENLEAYLNHLSDTETNLQNDFTEDFSGNDFGRISDIINKVRLHNKRMNTFTPTPNNKESSRCHTVYKFQVVNDDDKTDPGYLIITDMAGVESPQNILKQIFEQARKQENTIQYYKQLCQIAGSLEVDKKKK